MKTTPRNSSSRRPWLSLLALSLMAGSTPASHAATNMYWDPTGISAGIGGTGTWDNGTTAAWSASFAGTSTPAVWGNANNDYAQFGGTAGTVTVSGGVSAGRIVFSGAGYEIKGGTITIVQPTNAPFDAFATSGAFTGTNTVKNDIIVDGTASFGSEIIARFANLTDSNLVLDGVISFNFTGTGAGNKRLAFSQTGAGSITLNTAIGALPANFGTSYQEMHFGAYNGANNAGSYYVNANNSTNVTGAALIAKGTVYASITGALGSNTIRLGNGNSSSSGDNAKFLTVGAVNITNSMDSGGISNATPLGYIDTLHHEFGGSTADESTFSGASVYINQANLTVSAVAGGLVNVSSNITGGNAVGLGNLIKDGAGIVKFTRTNGNSYGFSGAKTTTVNAGTLILANTSGSGTGTSLVTVNTGASLGGTGFATGAVTAQEGTSIFTPGDMTIASVSSIGTLTLSGGLSATSGATFKMDLNGATNDKLAFGTGAVTLGGTITFDFINLGTVQTGTAYSLFTGTGTWSGAPTFAFNAPAGLYLDTTYGGGNGYIWDTTNHSLTVQFTTVPEPSTLALVALGGLAPLWLWKRRRQA